MARSTQKSSAAMNELRAYGLTFPGAHTKSPWPGHLDLAVKGKTFAFMSTDGEAFSLTCKLPSSGVAALMFPFASAAAYGLGKSGWVNARFEDGVTPPADVLPVFREWIEESYRATAPKKLVAALGADAERPTEARAGAGKKKTGTGTGTGKKSAAKKSAPKKTAATKTGAKKKRGPRAR
jgi:predicted DNA-binding protein (MmcQ/YjbR family)